MKSITSGHLKTNGGIRGHSAGDIFPWRVMAQGTMDNLKYWLIKPDGEKHSAFFTTAAAYSLGRRLSQL